MSVYQGRPFYTLGNNWLDDENYYNTQVQGTVSRNPKTTQVLTLDPNRNNIYFNGDWDNYHNWHSQNIVLPWLTSVQGADNINWEGLITNTLDSWNNAGGFQWLNATPEERQHGMQSSGTKTHQDEYYNNPILRLEDNIIGKNKSSYNIPETANSSDLFANGTRVGRNGQVSDNDFGIQTGNRRPTIHVNSNKNVTKQWDDFYKSHGYVGAYKYLDHWVPTKDKTKATRFFGQEPADLLSNVNNPSIPEHIDLSKVIEGVKKGSITGTDKTKSEESFLDKLSAGISNNIPALLETGRLIGNLRNNSRVYKTIKNGMIPVLEQAPQYHRQIVGDEAGKQAYYRRAAAGESQAARALTSDAVRQTAYQMENKRIGDELRNQGDILDNQEVRRTSDESSQLQYRNTENRVNVANRNTAALAAYRRDLANLKARKQSSDWTSWDNFLRGLATDAKQRQQQRQVIEDQIYALQANQNISNNSKVLDVQNRKKTIIENHTTKDPITGIETVDWSNPDVRNILEEEQKLKDTLTIEALKRKRARITSGKSGTKITRKNDLLYKSSKDAVEHFRKMYKITLEDTRKSRRKTASIKGAPKSHTTRKMQQGGAAPFTIYTPVVLGGETTISSQDTSGTSKRSNSDTSDNKKESIDMIKELFKAVQGKGLPSDVRSIYLQMNNMLDKVRYTGQELSTEDIASMYLQSLMQLSNIEQQKNDFDEAKKQAISNKGLNEFAVDNNGNFMVQDKNTGKVRLASLQEIKENGNLNPLTNNQLLSLRKDFLPFNNEIQEIVSNGVGMELIGEKIKQLLPNIGTDELVREGYTKHQAGEIKAGFELLQEAPNGDYTQTIKTKSQENQMKAALNYVIGILPNNMRSILEINSFKRGFTVPQLLQHMIGTTSHSYEETYTAVTGKAAKDANGNSKVDQDMIPAVAFFQGLGEQNTFVIQDKTTSGLRINTISAPITSKGSNTGQITLDKLSTSDFGGQLRMDLATMGDSLISPNGSNNIIIGERIYQTELPIDKNAASKGIIKPDLSFLKKIEKADAELKQQGIDKSDPKNIPTVNKVYQENGLPIVYTISGNKPTLTNEYGRFAMLNGMATEDAFDEEPNFNDGVTEVSGKEREQFESMMQTVSDNKKFKLSNSWFGGTKVYKGIIYIPMVSSTISALGGTGYKASGDEYNQIENLQQQTNAAIKLQYKHAGDASNLN